MKGVIVMSTVSNIKNREYRAHDWKRHIMGPSSGHEAFVTFESEKEEVEAIAGALKALETFGVIHDCRYDVEKFAAFRDAVRKTFEIPWTGISPRMSRLIYAINSIHRPQNLVCAGVFCGYTFICNAGASIGPGATYHSRSRIGLEILPVEAARAAENAERFLSSEASNIVCCDAVEWLRNDCDKKIDLLYIDAKSIEFDPRKPLTLGDDYTSLYLSIVQAAKPHLSKGSLILAHNSVNATELIQDYLDHVRSQSFSMSINMAIDDAGLEVTLV